MGVCVPDIVEPGRGAQPRITAAAPVLCHSQKVGLNRSPEKGVRYPKCEAPFGPFRFLVPDPVFLANPKTWFRQSTRLLPSPGESTQKQPAANWGNSDVPYPWVGVTGS